MPLAGGKVLSAVQLHRGAANMAAAAFSGGSWAGRRSCRGRPKGAGPRADALVGLSRTSKTPDFPGARSGSRGTRADRGSARGHAVLAARSIDKGPAQLPIPSENPVAPGI